MYRVKECRLLGTKNGFKILIELDFWENANINYFKWWIDGLFSNFATKVLRAPSARPSPAIIRARKYENPTRLRSAQLNMEIVVG